MLCYLLTWNLLFIWIYWAIIRWLKLHALSLIFLLFIVSNLDIKERKPCLQSRNKLDTCLFIKAAEKQICLNVLFIYLFVADAWFLLLYISTFCMCGLHTIVYILKVTEESQENTETLRSIPKHREGFRCCTKAILMRREHETMHQQPVQLVTVIQEG